MNLFECSKCGYFNGVICRKNGCERDSDEIVKDCKDFEYRIYYSF